MKRITANHYQTSERYYKLPKLLFESERYKDMKLEVKVAYAVLKDRLELSLSKGWIDEDGGILLEIVVKEALPRTLDIISPIIRKDRFKGNYYGLIHLRKRLKK